MFCRHDNKETQKKEQNRNLENFMKLMVEAMIYNV